MESSNRKPKDLKRNPKGFSDFDYTWNSILWSIRKNATIRGIPRNRSEFKKHGKPRGKCKTKKSKRLNSNRNRQSESITKGACMTPMSAPCWLIEIQFGGLETTPRNIIPLNSGQKPLNDFGYPFNVTDFDILSILVTLNSFLILYTIRTRESAL